MSPIPQSQAIDDIPPIMDALFECTLEMVSKNLEDFPEHRTNFFRMLQSVTQHCFPGEGGGSGNKRECLRRLLLCSCAYIVVS